MALSFRKFWEGIRLVAKAATSSTTKGDLEVLNSDSKIYYHNGTINSPLLTEAGTATLTNKTIVAANNTITTVASGNLSATELNAALAELDSDVATASGDLAAHLADPTDAHDASAISITAIPTIVATDVQGALAELHTDIDTVGSDLVAHMVDTVDAHDASSISNVPSGNLAATDVQAALNELQTDIDSRSSAITAKDEGSTLTTTMASINFVGANVTATNVGTAVTVTIASGGDVTGPASATDNHLARFDGTTGKLIQDGSTAVLSDAGALTGLTGLTSSGTVSSTGTLAIGGDLTEALTADAAATGANATISNPATSFLRLTNASLTSVDMISAPVSGEVITIENATGATISINNDTGGTAANRFLTGTKATLSLADEASIIVKYDATEARWMVIGGTGSGTGGSDPGCFIDLDASESLTTWTTGDNATFLGAGALSGTFVKESTAPLNGLFSYKYTQAAGSVNDYLASPAQSTALRFRGQTVTISFPYTYNGASNDIEVIVYDVTNSTVIPTSAFIQASTSVAIFKTNVVLPLTTTSIRIGFQTRVLSSGAIFIFDDIQVCTDATAYASVNNVTEWQTYTPTFGGLGTVSNNVAKWRRVGDSIQIEGTVTAGTVAAALATISLPNSYTIDASKISRATATSNGPIVGFYSSNTSDNTGSLIVTTSTSTSLIYFGDGINTGNATSATNGSSVLANAAEVSFQFTVPVTGLTASSTNILTAPDTFSTDTGSLVYASSATYTLATLANAPVGTFITFTYAINTNTRTQTTTAPTQTTADMNVNGMLIYTRAFNAASTAAQPAVFAVQIGKGLKGVTNSLYKSTGKVNSGSLDALQYTSTSFVGAALKEYTESTGILMLDAGYQTAATTSANFTFSDITTQTNGYLVINASKNPALTGLNINAVAARGVNTAGQSISNAASVTITYDAAKTYDTHAALNAATGVFTAPETGYYEASFNLVFSGQTYAIGNLALGYFYKNGAAYAYGTFDTADRAAVITMGSGGSTTVYLIKGETFEVKTENNRTAGATTLNTSLGYNHFSITKTNVG